MPKKTIPNAEWDIQKADILDYFIEQDNTLDQLVGHMGRRGFRASKAQFVRQLKEWKVSKNLSKQQWKAIIKQIKVREGSQNPLSDVWFQGRLLPSHTVRKARQRHDRPRLMPSPSPPPDAMEGIEVKTPPASPRNRLVHDLHDPDELQVTTTVNGDSCYMRGPIEVVLDGLPFLEFRRRLLESWEPRIWPSLQPSDRRLIEGLLPVFSQNMLSASDSSMVLRSFTLDSTNGLSLHPSIFDRISSFPIPLRGLDISSSSKVASWLIEFIVIGSTNGLLRPYKDLSLELLIDSISEAEALDEFLGVVRKFNFYAIIQKILELKTVASELFGAQALLSSVELEDEQLLELLLGCGVQLQEIRCRDISSYYCDLSALHIAVEQQNYKIIKRLLDAGFDPDGYITEDTYSFMDMTLRPLSHLVFMFSVNNEYRVPWISGGVVKVLLEFQREVYTIDHSENYLGTLFLNAWIVDAKDCMEAIREYCGVLNAREDGSQNLTFSTTIAAQGSDDAVVESILGSVLPLMLQRTATLDPYYSTVFIKASQRRIRSLVQAVLIYCKSVNRRFSDIPEGSLDADTVFWLLRSHLDLSHCARWLLKLAIQLEDFSLYQSLLEIYKSDVQTVSSLLSRRSKSLEFVKLAISHYNLHSNSGFQLNIDYLLSLDELCPTFLEELMLMENEHRSRPTLAHNRRLDKAAAGRIDLAATRLVVETFKKNGWFKDWAARFMQREEFCRSPLILRELLEIGAPATKQLLMVYASRPNTMDFWPLILSYNPELLYTITPKDISHRFGRFRDLKDNVSILIFLFQHGFNMENEWFKYMMSGEKRSFGVLFDGWPCGACSSYRKCTMPIIAAIKSGDLALVKGMIADDFETGRSWSESSCCASSRPLYHAIFEKRANIVRVLLQSGADISQSFFQGRGAYTSSLLEDAAESGHFAITCELLRAGADINAKVTSYGGSTAFEKASEHGQLDIVHLLMTNNLDLQKLKLDCKRAARLARRRHRNFIARLLEQKAKILTEELGERKIDRQVGSLCDCQISRELFEYRCTRCVNEYPTERSWLASLIYLTNMAPGHYIRFGLARELTGSETQDEIESLLFKVW